MTENIIIPVRIKKNYIPKDLGVKLLGTWALDQEDLGNDKDLTILEYIYDDFELLHDDHLYTKDLYTKLLPILGKILNDTHDLNWDIRSLKVFYGSWLQTYLPVIRERFQTVSKALEENPDDKFFLTNYEINISSSEEFKKKINEDEYNHFLYSKLLKFIDNERYNKSLSYCLQSKSVSRNVSRGGINLRLKTIFLSNLQIVLNLFSRNSKSAVDRSYFSLKDFIKLIFWTFPSVMPIVYFPQLNQSKNKFNQALRDKLTIKLKNFYLAENIFEEFLLENIFRDVPIDFIENFKKVYEASNYINIKDKNILSTNAILFNQVFQCAVANQLSLSKNLIIVQHGGSYGIVRWSMQEFYELDMADKFISFGWSRLDYSHIQKISHPKLLKNFKKNKVTNNKILYITWGPSRFFNRSWSNPIAGKSISNYYSNMLIFLRNFDTSIGKIYIRLSPSNYEYKIGIEKFFGPTFNYADGDFYDEIQSASLVVCDHNQTTFLESLTNNKPTIIVWNTDYTKITDTALLYFDELRSAGIFFNSHIEASNYLNDIIAYSSIDDWWMDSSRQVVVRSFVENFAKRNVNWIEDYKKLLSI